MKGGCKRGKMSNEEIEYIANHPTQSDEKIAKALNRTVTSIKKNRGQIAVKIDLNKKESHVEKLKASSTWKETKRGFINYFEEKFFQDEWSGYMDQFIAAGISKVDENIFKDLIWLDIFCNRFLEDRADSSRRRKKLEKELDDERELGEDADRGRIAELNSQIKEYRDVEKDCDVKFERFSKEKSGKLKSLQDMNMERLKQETNADKNVFALFKKLSSKPMRKKEGILLEKVKVSVDQLQKEWEESYRYQNDEICFPLLTPEGVLKREEEKGGGEIERELKELKDLKGTE